MVASAALVCILSCLCVLQVEGFNLALVFKSIFFKGNNICVVSGDLVNDRQFPELIDQVFHHSNVYISLFAQVTHISEECEHVIVLKMTSEDIDPLINHARSKNVFMLARNSTEKSDITALLDLTLEAKPELNSNLYLVFFSDDSLKMSVHETL